MNNDILVPPGFAERLIEFATANQLKVVSPARIDGVLDYDFSKFASTAQNITAQAVRWNSSNAVCMCIHWSLFQQIGFFRADPNLLGFEDGLFYNEIRMNGIRHATSGSVWIHHFGSVTQVHLKEKFGLNTHSELVKVNDRKLYGQTWLERKLYRHRLKMSSRAQRLQELRAYGMTLHGLRINDEFQWI
jgi:GT2 family glycosyltransferase